MISQLAISIYMFIMMLAVMLYYAGIFRVRLAEVKD